MPCTSSCAGRTTSSPDRPQGAWDGLLRGTATLAWVEAVPAVVHSSHTAFRLAGSTAPECRTESFKRSRDLLASSQITVGY